MIGGIEVLFDVESFDYTYNGKDSVGFRFVFVNPGDQPMLNQDGYLIPPGKQFYSLVINHVCRVLGDILDRGQYLRV
jgi:hypothetical protein